MKSSGDDMRNAYKRDLSRVKTKGRTSKKELQQMARNLEWERLTEIMLPYALQLAHNYQALTATAGLDFMDLVQEAAIATMQAVKAWKPDGSALTTVIKFYVKGRFHRLSKGFQNQTVSIDQIMEFQTSDYPGLLSQIQEALADDTRDPESLYIYQQAIEQMELAANKLPDRQRVAVRAFCGLDNGTPLTLSEVAAEMGISVPAAKKLLDKGLTIPE